MKTSPAAIVIDDIVIRQDAEGRYCLNDIHKAAGGRRADQPNHFLILQKTMALAHEIQSRNSGSAPIETVTGGASPGTFVAKQLVYAYAMWISAEFNLKVIDAYDRLATQGVAVHENHAENFLANPIKYFGPIFEQAKQLADENAKLGRRLAVNNSIS